MRLETYLSLSGLTQAEFAQRIGASQGSVSKYCAGRAFPSPAILARIAAATGDAVTANDFVRQLETTP